MNLAKTCLTLTCAFALALAGTAAAQEGDSAPAASASSSNPKNLFELLDLVKKGLQSENIENTRREEAFADAKENQARLLAEAKQTLAEKEALSLKYETQYNDNERAIGQSEADLAEQLGQMGELFGVVRQVANDPRVDGRGCAIHQSSLRSK